MEHPSGHNEKQLVMLLRQRNRGAITSLYESHAPALYNIIVHIVKVEEVAREVLQDGFLKIWENIDQYDEKKGRLFTWMVRIVRNTAIDTLRSKQFKEDRKTDGLPDYVNNDERFSEVPTMGDPAFRRVLDQLNDRDRKIIDLLYFQEYSQREASEAMDIPLGTIKTRVRKAILQLRQILGSE